MRYFVYAIKSAERDYVYKGLTKNIENRLERHRSGRERTTRAYRPFKLVYLKSFDNRAEARRHEEFIKSGVGRDFLRMQTRADVAELADAQA